MKNKKLEIWILISIANSYCMHYNFSKIRKAYEAMRIRGNSLSRHASAVIEVSFHTKKVTLYTAYLKWSYFTIVVNSRSNSCWWIQWFGIWSNLQQIGFQFNRNSNIYSAKRNNNMKYHSNLCYKVWILLQIKIHKTMFGSGTERQNSLVWISKRSNKLRKSQKICK